MLSFRKVWGFGSIHYSMVSTFRIRVSNFMVSLKHGNLKRNLRKLKPKPALGPQPWTVKLGLLTSSPTQRCNGRSHCLGLRFRSRPGLLSIFLYLMCPSGMRKLLLLPLPVQVLLSLYPEIADPSHQVVREEGPYSRSNSLRNLTSRWGLQLL